MDSKRQKIAFKMRNKTGKNQIKYIPRR